MSGTLDFRTRSDRDLLASLIAARFSAEGLESVAIEPGRCLSYLHEAATKAHLPLFQKYLCWCRDNSPDHGQAIALALSLVRRTLEEHLTPEESARVVPFLERAQTALAQQQNPEPNFLPELPPFSTLANSYLFAVLSGDGAGAGRIIETARQAGSTIRELYLYVLQPVQYEVGRLWHLNRIGVAEEHFCTAVTQRIMIDLYPKIISSRRIGKTVVSCCAGPELHEVGIRMVNDFFEMAGWDSYYLGAGWRPEELLQDLAARLPDLIAISATMTHHLDAVRDLIAQVRRELPQPSPRIMVGGALFNRNQELWRAVGADLWAANAEDAVRRAGELFGLPPEEALQ